MLSCFWSSIMGFRRHVIARLIIAKGTCYRGPDGWMKICSMYISGVASKLREDETKQGFEFIAESKTNLQGPVQSIVN